LRQALHMMPMAHRTARDVVLIAASQKETGIIYPH
jgi:hypothetical protein